MVPEPPAPPDNFSSKLLPTHTISAGDSLYRIQDRKHDDPLFFGTNGTNRFDDPDQEFGVCYLSESKQGAFVETIGRDKLSGAPIPLKLLQRLVILQFRVTEIFEVVDLQAQNLLALGGNASITGGSDYSCSQQWSAALHKHPDQIDGIRYRACHDNTQLSVALFERYRDVAQRWPVDNLGTVSDEKDFLADMIRQYRIELV